jgi:phosphonate transport system substrate-binding protein
MDLKKSGIGKTIALLSVIAVIIFAFFAVLTKFYTPAEPFVDIDFATTAPERENTAQNPSDELRFAVATMWSVESTFTMYQRLIDRICTDVGLQDSFVLRSSYGSLRKAIENGEVDAAFVCTGPYIYALPSGKIKLLVEPLFVDDHQYHSVIIAPSGSNIESIKDLEGTVLGLSDPESFTGCMVPYVMFTESGYDIDTYFEKVIFTGSHDRTIHAVERGIVSAAAVHSVVLESAKREDPALMDRIKVIWTSETFGPPPIIIAAEMEDSLADSLREAFINMHNDEDGRMILSSIGIERFLPADEKNYDTAIELYERYKKLGGSNWP